MYSTTQSYGTRDLLSTFIVNMSSPSQGTRSHVDDSHSYSRDSEFFIDVRPLYLRVSQRYHSVI